MASNDLWGNLPFKSRAEAREILITYGCTAEQIEYVFAAKSVEEVNSRLSEVREQLPQKFARITMINNEVYVADLGEFQVRMTQAFNHRDEFVRIPLLDRKIVSLQRNHIVAVEEVTR